MPEYMDEIVLRQAPRWAWDAIDTALVTSPMHRELYRDAIHAMLIATEEPQRQVLPRSLVRLPQKVKE